MTEEEEEDRVREDPWLEHHIQRGEGAFFPKQEVVYHSMYSLLVVPSPQTCGYCMHADQIAFMNHPYCM